MWSAKSLCCKLVRPQKKEREREEITKQPTCAEVEATRGLRRSCICCLFSQYHWFTWRFCSDFDLKHSSIRVVHWFYPGQMNQVKWRIANLHGTISRTSYLLWPKHEHMVSSEGDNVMFLKLTAISFSPMISSQKLEKKIDLFPLPNVHPRWNAEHKEWNAEDMAMTSFVFAPAAGRPNRWRQKYPRSDLGPPSQKSRSSLH